MTQEHDAPGAARRSPEAIPQAAPGVSGTDPLYDELRERIEPVTFSDAATELRRITMREHADALVRRVDALAIERSDRLRAALHVLERLEQVEMCEAAPGNGHD